MYELYIANKNYSSWSLRPWVLMRELEIGFVERLVPFGSASSWEQYRSIAPSGKVPCLVDGAQVVWDSLAIVEYLAERHAGVWPDESGARAWARSAVAEMHSGFTELRRLCPMSCGVRIRLNEIPGSLERDLERIRALWSDGLRRFGGPFLSGRLFSAVDAFFAPVAFRIQTYRLALDAVSDAYTARLLHLHSMQEWYDAALGETLRYERMEAEMPQRGVVVEDFRAR